MKSDNEKNPWQTLSSKIVYETPWLRVVEHECLSPTKLPAQYGVVEFKNTAIGILALDANLNIYLVGQWRYPLKQYSWEIPEGGGRLSSDPLEEAKRELKEEAGVTATQWNKYFEMHLSNSTTNERALVYVATDLTVGESAPEETEILKVKKVSLKNAYRMVVSGEITDAISVAAIQRLYIDKFHLEN